MTKIKNTDAYPYKIPVPQDFVTGTDSETEAKDTVSYKFEDIATLVNSINGNEVVSYVFAESPVGELDENGIGYFLSENNETNPEDVTKLIVSKKIKTGIDLSELFEFMLDNKDNFILKLRNVSNPNNFIYFEIDNIIENTYQFTFEVSVYKMDYFEGALIDTKTYAFDFNLKAGNSPDSYTKIVYVNAVSPTIATIFDTQNPPVSNDNTLKNDVSNLYIGNDASTWVYITSPDGYITKTISVVTSNFYLSGTVIDAGTSKSAPIERTGTVGGAPGTLPDHFVTKAQHDLKENLSNKQNSLITDGTGVKYPTVDAINAVLPASYSKVVYVNSIDPNIATIFDMNNPPVTNDDLLKSDSGNLYIGSDASTWVYNMTTTTYVTKAVAYSSNFFLSGTTVDSGSNKNSPISRTSSVEATGFIASSETVNTIASFDATKTIKSLSTATYPSLTELSYVKGLTSNAQTQITARALDNNVVHLSGNETRSNGSLTFRTNTNANAFILIDPLAQAITAYNTSNVISWRLTNLGASQGNGSLGTASSFFYWREAGGNQLGASVQLTVPPATVAGSALNKGQFDAVLLASVSAVLDFPATATGANSDLTIAYTGAVLGDMVILGSPIPVTGSMYTAFVSDVGVVTVRLNNYSVASVNPASGTFKVKIIR